MKPPFYGNRIITDIDLERLYPLLDREFLFAKLWQVKNREVWEKKLEPVLDKWKENCKKENLLNLKLSYGYFPCRIEKELVIVNWGNWEYKFYFPRKKGFSLADYFRNLEFLSCQIVTAGNSASEYEAKLLEEDQYSDYFYFHGFVAGITEAMAGYWENQISEELGGKHTKRYSLGYPACPNLEEQIYLSELLKFNKIGVSVTETYHLVPELSTSAFIVIE